MPAGRFSLLTQAIILIVHDILGGGAWVVHGATWVQASEFGRSHVQRDEQEKGRYCVTIDTDFDSYGTLQRQDRKLACERTSFYS
jgi:hypothetical protein